MLDYATASAHQRPNSWTKYRQKSLKSYLLAIQSLLYSFALRFLFLQTHATSYSFCSALVYTLKEKVGKPESKPHPIPYGLRNPNRDLKSENSQDYGQKPQRNCTFMNLDSVRLRMQIKDYRGGVHCTVKVFFPFVHRVNLLHTLSQLPEIKRDRPSL
jgi:hypothetical protein